MRLLVHYTYRSGEDETGCEVLMESKENPKCSLVARAEIADLIHSKFSRFWGETDTDEMGKYYVHKQGYLAVKIERYSVVPNSDWKVLKKYLTEI